MPGIDKNAFYVTPLRSRSNNDIEIGGTVKSNGRPATARNPRGLSVAFRHAYWTIVFRAGDSLIRIETFVP